MKHTLASSLLLMSALIGCASNPEQPTLTPENQANKINDFPTRDRVEYVLECVAKHGGLNYINQYACGCKLDKVAEKMSFADFESARTFSQMQKTPGESGSAFRDPKQSKDLRAQLTEVEEQAEKACFVK